MLLARIQAVRIFAAQVASPSVAAPAIRKVARNAQSLAVRRAGWWGVMRVARAVELLAVRRAGWCGVMRVPVARAVALPGARRQVRPGEARKLALVPAQARQASAAAPADSQPAGA
jgi:hypothetical protein